MTDVGRAAVVTIHLETMDVMTTPFVGEAAAVQAHAFMEGEKRRGDFPDYEWVVVANEIAAEYRAATIMSYLEGMGNRID